MNELKLLFKIFFTIFYLFIYWVFCVACGILVPKSRVKPMPSAVKAQSLDHWTAGEVSEIRLLIEEKCISGSQLQILAYIYSDGLSHL